MSSHIGNLSECLPSKSIADAQKRIEELITERAKLVDIHANEISEGDTMRSQLLLRISTLEDSLATTETKLADTKMQLEETQKIVFCQNQQIDEMGQQLERKVDAIKTLESKICDLETVCSLYALPEP